MVANTRANFSQSSDDHEGLRAWPDRSIGVLIAGRIDEPPQATVDEVMGTKAQYQQQVTTWGYQQENHHIVVVTIVIVPSKLSQSTVGQDTRKLHFRW